MNTLESLPEELIYKILYSIDGPELFRLCGTNKHIGLLCDNSVFWTTKIDLIRPGLGTAFSNKSIIELKDIYLTIYSTGGLYLYIHDTWHVLKKEGISQVACGQWHMIYLNTYGEIYSWGNNRSGQLGLGTLVSNNIPEKITHLQHERVKQIACGYIHSALVTYDGTVYTWGDNQHGQLGQGYTGTNMPLPVLIENFDNIKQVACGTQHTAFLSENGEVYITGNGTWGQLGLGQLIREVDKPTLITGLEKIKYLACGEYHTLLVTEKGNLYGFGSNYDGQLGVGIEKENIYEPTPIVLPPDFTGVIPRADQVAGGTNHSIIRTTTGQVYTVGINRRGQLGLGDVGTQITPRRIRISEKISSVAAGFDNSGFITQKGVLYIFGKPIPKQFGIRDVPAYNIQKIISILYNKVLIKFSQVKQLAFGEGMIALIN